MLKFFSNTMVSCVWNTCWKNNKILYNRYVDDILMLINNNKVAEDNTLNRMNNVLEILMKNRKHWVPYVVFQIYSWLETKNKFQIDIRRISIKNTIHVTFNHLMEHEIIAYRLLINRVYRLSLILVPERKSLELNTAKHLQQRNWLHIKLSRTQTPE